MKLIEIEKYVYYIKIYKNIIKEFDKIGGYTIERTFAFDRNTDIGPIQIGDRFHACIIGQELYPPEGSECEKRIIKHTLINPILWQLDNSL